MNRILEVQNLCKTYSNNLVVSDATFNINKGEVIAIIGPSGAGKTTLLRCINFLEKADSGTLIFNNQQYDLHKINKEQIQSIRMQTSFVFQNFNLFLNKTVLQNITEGLIVARKIKKNVAIQKASELLKKVGLENHTNYYPNQLSGGQQQRVAIARALATEPEIIYFDEPTSALDPELTSEVLEVIKTLATEGKTMVVVTHEMNFAKTVSNKIIFMENGKILEQSASKDFFLAPKTKRAKDFLFKIGE